MKKIITLFTSVVLAAALAACGVPGSGSLESANEGAGNRESQGTANEGGENLTPTDDGGENTKTQEPADGSAGTQGMQGQPDETQAGNPPEASGTEPEVGGGNVLVVYFSATGNTEAVANTIAEATGGELFELVPVNAYSDADLDWTDDDSRVVYEHEHPDDRNVELAETAVPDWDSYDTVFIGYAGGIIGLN